MNDRICLICYSKDGGRNFSNWKEKPLGEVGEYTKRVRIRQLGVGLQWVFKIRVSSPIKRDLLGAVAHLEASN